MNPNQKTLIVIGGGAAGFFCAVNAARLAPTLKVMLLEKSSKLLSKVKVSGGGRCNVTHACFTHAAMLKKYPRGHQFLKKGFYQFFTTDTVDWFEKRNVALHTEADGRMFPVSNSSQTVIDCLLNDANKYAVEIMLNAGVVHIEKNTNEKFSLKLAKGELLTADYLCIASGGFPKAAQFDWITSLGHQIALPVPSLFTFNMPGNPITSLMGISVENVIVKIAGTKFQESGPLLITHWGLSGPAVLKLSAWAARDLHDLNYSFTINVNWLPNYNEQTLREAMQTIRFQKAATKIYNRNPFALPARLWEFMLSVSGITDSMRWADLPAKEQNKLIKMLCAHDFEISGKTTFKEEFVTSGGIVTEEIDAQTMMSKLQPNLFFAGEVINVDGVTGGFNFQSAWTTGWIAANAIANKMEAL